MPRIAGSANVVSKETVLPSGSEPRIRRPSHSAKPRRVPNHIVSPLTVMLVTLSTGRPSKLLTRSQVLPSSESRLKPEPEVPTHRRPTRSKLMQVRLLLAIVPGSRTIGVNVLVARSKRSSPPSAVAHQTTSPVTARSAKSRTRMCVCHAPFKPAAAAVAAPEASGRSAAASANAATKNDDAARRCVRIKYSLPAAEQIQQAQPPDHPRRFPDDATVHFRDSRPPVDEDDRDLLDLEAALPALERHLDLERVAVRAHAVEADPFEGAATEALEPARGIVDRQAGDDTSVHVGRPGEDQPFEGPVDHPDPVEVARPEDHVGVAGRLEERPDGVGVVGEVGVHLEDVLGPLIERVAEAVAVGRTQPQLARSLEQMDARRGGHPLLHDRGGAVGRVVVDDEDVQVEGQRHQSVEQRRNVLAFVVGGDDDELLHQRAPTFAAGPAGVAPAAPARPPRPRTRPSASSASAAIRLAIEIMRPSRTAGVWKRKATVCVPAGTATARSRKSARRISAGLPSTVATQSGYQRSATRSSAGPGVVTRTARSFSR